MSVATGGLIAIANQMLLQEEPGRDQIGVLAEQLTSAARTGQKTSRAELLGLAAELRLRMWRISHADADARSALELYRAVQELDFWSSGAERCRSMLAEAQLAAVLANDPLSYYRGLHLASKRSGAGGCSVELSTGVGALAAYRPSPAALGEWERQASADTSITSHATDLDGAVATDFGGAVATDLGRAPVTAEEDGIVIIPPIADGPGAAKVLSIVPYSSVDRARIVIALSAPRSFRVVGATPAPGKANVEPRIVLELRRTIPDAHSVVPAFGLVRQIRQSTHADGARLTILLSRMAYRRIFYLPEPFRIIIDIATHPPSSFGVGSPGQRRVRRVALDPGHGGSDPGATGPSGLREKDVVLDIAHRAAPVLSRELGIATLLTRDGDHAVALDERAARANAFHADLFVSIHCNASETSGSRGVMTFVLDASADDLAARTAARENATSVTTSPAIAAIAQRLQFGEVNAHSQRLASLLQRSAMASLAQGFRDASDQGVKSAGFFVLLGAEMPSVLFETSFISNPIEEKRLASPEYRQKMADAIINAIRAYGEGR